MDWEQLSQILEPVHDMIASTRATAIELRQHGVREPQLTRPIQCAPDGAERQWRKEPPR
jgi:hypothetical protein